MAAGGVGVDVSDGILTIVYACPRLSRDRLVLEAHCVQWRVDN
jgi:hypothetical protein